MKTLGLCAALVLASVSREAAEVAAPSPRLLPARRDLFFVEDDLVYSRYLLLSRDGTYRQIQQENHQSRMTDQGEWQQDLRGSLRLHSTRDALRYRALLSGPLSLVPNCAPVLDALPTVATRIRRFLGRSTDSVFASAAANDLQAPPAEIIVSRNAGTFSRGELVSLANQIDRCIESARTHIYTFEVLKPKNLPLLLVQTDAVFQSRDVARIVATFPRLGVPLPFYFTQVNTDTFARRVGAWQELPLLGNFE